MNFDQVLDPALSSYHGWYDLPKRIKSWEVGRPHLQHEQSRPGEPACRRRRAT